MDEPRNLQHPSPTTEAGPRPARRPYQPPRIRSSAVFERAAAGCGVLADEEPCDGIS